MYNKQIESLRWWEAKSFEKYPHLNKYEVPIITSWLDDELPGLTRMSYDVPVGLGRIINDEICEYMHLDWKYLTALKIDALADFSGQLAIIEIKPVCSMKSIGQLLCYKLLFTQKYEFFGEIELIALSEAVYPDLLPLLPTFGIEYVQARIKGKDYTV